MTRWGGGDYSSLAEAGLEKHRQTTQAGSADHAHWSHTLEGSGQLALYLLWGWVG